MSRYGAIRVGPMLLRWRSVEWGLAGTALFLQAGGLDGLGLGKPLLALSFACTIVLVAANAGQLVLAMRRTPLIVFLVALPLLSLAWTSTVTTTFGRGAVLTLGMALAAVLAVRFSPRQLVLLLALALLPSLLMSLVQLGMNPGARAADGTYGGAFGMKNLLGWNAAIALIAGGTILTEHVYPRKIGLAVVGTSIPCLLASGSGTAVVMVFIAGLLVLFHATLRRIKGKSRVLFALLTLQTVVAVLFVGSIIVPVLLETLGKDATLTGRVPLWHAVDAAILRRPILGYGYQVFWSEGSSLGWQVRATAGWDAPNAHNGFREILLNFGLFGFLPFMALLARTLHGGAVLHTSSSDHQWLGANVLIGALIAMNWTETMFYEPYNIRFIIFMMLAMAVAVRAPEQVVNPSAGRAMRPLPSTARASR